MVVAALFPPSGSLVPRNWVSLLEKNGLLIEKRCTAQENLALLVQKILYLVTTKVTVLMLDPEFLILNSYDTMLDIILSSMKQGGVILHRAGSAYDRPRFDHRSHMGAFA